jgi:hypothetical protein
MFCAFTLVLSEVHVCGQCSLQLFSVVPGFPCKLVKCFLNDFQMLPFAPMNTGITSVFTFHMRCISIVRTFMF